MYSLEGQGEDIEELVTRQLSKRSSVKVENKVSFRVFIVSNSKHMKYLGGSIHKMT